MPTGQIRVRLVPKTKDGAAAPANFFAAATRTARSVAPAAEHGLAALPKAHALGVQAALSVRNAVDGTIPVERFKQVFGRDLEEFKLKAGERSDLAQPGVTHLKPKGALKVPTELKDEIDFAYVPTPPEFMALHVAPPSTSVNHLRIEDVARILGAYRCHRNGWSGRGIRVAMADTGFATHPFFEHHGFNIERVHTATTSNPGDDPSGHGTGESANVLVLAPNCTFIGVKHDDYSAQALELSIAQNPRIMTHSWGWNIDNQTFDELKEEDENLFNEVRDIANIIGTAIAQGITVVFSGGNGHLAFPACLPDVIAVGGVTARADGVLMASSYASSFESKLYPGRRVPDFCGVVGESGAKPMRWHIMLPVPNGCELEGENLPAPLAKRGWGLFSGTSASAPQVAGIIALMLSVNPNLTPADIKSILASTCRDVTEGASAHGEVAGPGVDLATGSGFVDAFEACLRVRQQLPPG